MPGVHIPRPCPVDRQALTPTADGWHCARCQHEVVDFTRLSEAEVLAYLAARPGQRVCARLAAPARPVPRPPKGPRRWLLAALALLGVSSAAARAELPPRPLPLAQPPGQPQPGRIPVRGTVLDDSTGAPVPHAFIFLDGTRFGAVTDERGEFSFSVATHWKPARDGQLLLVVSAGHFIYHGARLTVNLTADTIPPPLVVRLRPATKKLVGKIGRHVKPPVPPPGSRRK